MIKQGVSAILNRTGYEQLGVFLGWARRSGWWRSLVSKRPVDGAGDPLPWYCYPCIHFLEARITPDLRASLRVFEFGSGNSTLWWARHAREVVAVEDNAQWFDYVRRAMPGNVNYLRAEDAHAYVGSLAEQPGAFDVIVVDGSHREQCARRAVAKLSRAGVIVVDNSDWPSLAPTLESLKAAGLRHLEFHGHGPMNGHPWSTSIFYRDGNVFSL